MAIFDEPLYLTKYPKKNYVYVGGKPEEKTATDFQNGDARMGGFWRSPNYLESYLTAAELLIEQGVKRQDYDDIGLPTFFLQRHATELLLKRLLKWCIDIVELKAELVPEAGHRVPSTCRKALNGSHDLQALLKFLKRVAGLAGEDPPPSNLENLVGLLTQVEKDHHWSRYGHGNRNNKTVFHHQVEATIPIVELQKLLEEVANSILSRSMGDETYENELYSTWHGLTCALDEFGV